MDPKRLAALRRGYADEGLSEADLAPDPFAQFDRWLAEAVDAHLTEPNAMVLATVGPQGRPSARTLLLKAVDARGFVFFTNYTSRKGRELSAHPYASLLFPWHDLERQVVVLGEVARVDVTESEAYFRSRPYGSRIGAWASRQSQVVAGREVFERRSAELAARWPADVPMPEFWGGYRLVPESVEFWQGRSSRLHDRLRYTRDASDSPWRVERLSP